MVNEKGNFELHSQLLEAIQLLATVQALGHTVVRRQRVFRRGEEGFMAFHHQFALPLSVNTPQLPVSTGHVGGARGVHTQNL